jgi:isopenicillin-N epimerase
VQPWLLPLVVSWGWESDHPSGSTFVDHHEWQGTRDLSPFLAVGPAIDFVEAHDWATVRAEGHARVLQARRAVDALTGLAPISPDQPLDHEWIGQLAAMRLPDGTDVVALKEQLFDRCHIEVPLHRWNDQPLIRVSCTAHTTDADIDALVEALRELL